MNVKFTIGHIGTGLFYVTSIYVLGYFSYLDAFDQHYILQTPQKHPSHLYSDKVCSIIDGIT